MVFVFNTLLVKDKAEDLFCAFNNNRKSLLTGQYFLAFKTGQHTWQYQYCFAARVPIAVLIVEL